MQKTNDQNEAPKVSIGLECYIKKGEKYLVHKRNLNKRILPGVWMAPGGHVELHEGIFEAARREVREETGLEITHLRLRAIGVGHLEDINDYLYIYILTAEYKSGALTTDPKDGTFAWRTVEEILALDTLLEELRLVLPHVFSTDPTVISYTAVYDKGSHMTEFVLEPSE